MKTTSKTLLLICKLTKLLITVATEVYLKNTDRTKKNDKNP